MAAGAWDSGEGGLGDIALQYGIAEDTLVTRLPASATLMTWYWRRVLVGVVDEVAVEAVEVAEGGVSPIVLAVLGMRRVRSLPSRVLSPDHVLATAGLSALNGDGVLACCRASAAAFVASWVS